ncbi:MAG: glycosyltransferase family 4 protein [Candidatus Andersenbacteria bacterium]
MSKDVVSRVLFVTRAKNNQAGGMERLSHELIKAITHTNLAVDVIAHYGRRYTAPLFVITCLPRVWRQAKKADVVHIGDPLLALVGWVVKKFLHKPVVMTVHGLDVTYPHPLYQLYLQIFLPSADQYIAISRHVKSLLRRRGLGQRVTVIPPGITDKLYNPHYTRQDLSHVLGSNLANKVVLLTTGRLVPRKGHAWFITHVLPTLPSHVVYVIAGEGQEKDHIIRVSKRAGLHERVHVLGRVTDEALAILTNTSDAFVQPNIAIEGDTEGFGLVLLEAAICARPVFAANLEGIPDAITPGKNGVLLPSGNKQAWIVALEKFIATPHQHVPTGMEARQYTYNYFAWQKIVEQYRTVFSTVTMPVS